MANPKQSVIVFGPQGCGKTRNAERIARYYGLKTIVDDFSPGDQAPKFGALILTNMVPDPDVALTSRHFTFIAFDRLPATLRK